jgi:DNA polymerase-3 subunit beta
MKTQAAKFAAAVAGVQPLIKSRATVPILTCLKVWAADGLLTVVATDFDAYASVSCPCEGDLEPICVDAQQLEYLARQAKPDEMIDFSIENGKLVVRSNGTARLSILDAAEFPKWPTLSGTNLGVNALDLADCIGGVIWATEPNPKVTIDRWRELVWVKCTAKSIEACGTNSKELAYVNKPVISAAVEFLFPSKHAKLLVDALNGGASEVTLNDKFISASSGTAQVALKLAEGKYVPIQYVIGQRNTPLGPLGSVEMAPILEALHTIKALGRDEEYLPAKIEFGPFGIRILFHTERVNFEKVIEHKHEGPPILIRVDVARAIRVFSRVHPAAKAAVGDQSILFFCGDWTYALGLLHG